MGLLPEGIKPDYHKQEAGFAWFTTETAKLLVRSTTRASLPKITGLDPVKCQHGALRFRFWSLEDDMGRVCPMSAIK